MKFLLSFGFFWCTLKGCTREKSRMCTILKKQFLVFRRVTFTHWRARNFYLWDYSPGVWGRNSPRGSRGEATVGKTDIIYIIWLQTQFTDFDYGNDQNLNISHNSPPDSWLGRFSLGAKRHFWGAPAWRHQCLCGRVGWRAQMKARLRRSKNRHPIVVTSLHLHIHSRRPQLSGVASTVANSADSGEARQGLGG